VDAMPLVLVARDPEKVPDDILAILARELPGIVARRLSVPEIPAAMLNPEDVEVRFRDFGRFDVRSRSLEIVVVANDYPERRRCHRERAEQITENIRALIPSDLHDFWVWVLLVPGEFVEVVM
jgi:hypothetical protein